MKINDVTFNQVLSEIKVLAENEHITIRFERGDFKGGYCVMKNSRLIVINKLNSPLRRIIILIEALSEFGVGITELSADSKILLQKLEVI